MISPRLEGFCVDKSQLKEAQVAFDAAAALAERHWGKESPNFASALLDSAMVAGLQKRTDDQDALLKRSLAIREANFGKNGLDVGRVAALLGEASVSRGDLAGATRLFERSLEICRLNLGLDHPESVKAMLQLAAVLVQQKQYASAEQFYAQALTSCQIMHLPPDSPLSGEVLVSYAHMLEAVGRASDAQSLYNRIPPTRASNAPPRTTRPTD